MTENEVRMHRSTIASRLNRARNCVQLYEENPKHRMYLQAAELALKDAFDLVDILAENGFGISDDYEKRLYILGTYISRLYEANGGTL